MTAPQAGVTHAHGVHLADRLAADGYVVAAGHFNPALCQALAVEGLALATDPSAIDAGIGRGAQHTAAPEVRRARICWLDGTTAAQREFLAEAEALRTMLNRTLYLGLHTFEAQLALTPAGGFYSRHVDSFQGKRNRVVSMVAYLNADWQGPDGGALRLWPPATQTAIDVRPEAGTLVLMMSEMIPHEVLLNSRPRASIAGWFRIRGNEPADILS